MVRVKDDDGKFDDITVKVNVERQDDDEPVLHLLILLFCILKTHKLLLRLLLKTLMIWVQ